MTESSPTPDPTYQYRDDAALLGVSVTADRGIVLEARGTGVSAGVGLTVLGAQRLITMLGSAITTAITRGLGGGR